MADELATLVTDIARRARAASLVLAIAPTAAKNAALMRLADLLPASKDALLAANAQDQAAAQANNLTSA
jgi:glutamate-5-semialdehyde dehydrogenase